VGVIQPRVAGGEYARKQIFCPSALVRWSHRSRFDLARRLVTPDAGGRLLDYGCGDGTFLAMVHDLFPAAVGTDADAEQLMAAAGRLRSLALLVFLPPAALGPSHNGRYDVVTCMEVLEHCTPPVRHDVLADLRRLVAPDGRVVLSVPIEIGLSLPAKQIARRFAGWRGLGDYRHAERYAFRELLTMTLAGPETEIGRPLYTNRDGNVEYAFHGHKGFNWHALEREVTELFIVEERRCSPMPWLGTLLNSQLWMVCRSR
jgi:SAM-dependent methyltransferase